MSDILDQIDASLEEVEEQLLREFNRFRTGDETGPCRLDNQIHEALMGATGELRQQLDHSGNTRNLELRTERHEVLEARIGVIEQLLENEIPGSALLQAHEDIETSRRRLEKRVAVRRKKLEEAEGKSQKPSGQLRGLFGRVAGDREAERNRIRVTRQEEQDLQDVEVFLDNGIYSASRELAMLANLIKRGATDRPPADQPRGKAVFMARELSSTLRPVNKVKPVEEKPAPEAAPEPSIAQTPEEIRRKLEARRDSIKSSGASRFEARDLSSTAPPPSRPPERKEEKSSPVARTPEEIRRKLEERQYQSAGKASFASKDIEPEWESKFEKAEKSNDENKEKDSGKSGKAKFESRDLSQSPWRKG